MNLVFDSSRLVNEAVCLCVMCVYTQGEDLSYRFEQHISGLQIQICETTTYR